MRTALLTGKQIAACMIIFLTFFHKSLFSQASLTKAIIIRMPITSFGANGADDLDDTWAFIKAGRYINNEWDINGVPLVGGAVNYNATTSRIRLEIRSGTYYVGKQIVMPAGSCNTGYNTTYGQVFGYPAATTPISLAANRAKWFGLEVISLSNVNQVEVIGTGTTKPIIRYNLGLYIGYFDCSGNPKIFNGTGTGSGYSNIYEANIGNFILANNCQNLSIQNLEIDGRNSPPLTASPSATATNYGGTVGSSDLIQMGADALQLINTKAITISNMNVHHMTRDGIQLSDAYSTPTSTDPSLFTKLNVDNSIFENNRRQGFSWVGGRVITVTNSKFNLTGQSVYNWNGGVARGLPGAGIDIEPNANVYCMDADFSNCEFVNNTGRALDCNVTVRTKNINFTSNTKFHDIDADAVWVRGPGFTFSNCLIWGGVIHGNASGISGDETRFFNCDFADEEYQGVFTGQRQHFNTTTAKKTLFSSCTFRTIHPDMRMFFIDVPFTSEANFPVFSNCSFTCGTSSSQGALSGGADNLFNCTFDGVNTFANNNTTARYLINARGLVFTGSSDPCSPNSFSLNGLTRITHDVNGQLLQTLVMGRDGIGATTNNGYFNFNIGAKSLFYYWYYGTINIGSNSILRNQTDGMLVIREGNTQVGNTVINNKGKIILEAGSSTLFPNTLYTTINGGVGSEFYYHKNASTLLNSYWPSTQPALNISSGLLQSLQLVNTKFDGGNIAVNIPALITSSNEALEFDGVNDYVNIPFTSGVAPLGFDWSVTNSFGIEIAFKKSFATATESLLNQSGPEGYGLNVFFEGGLLNVGANANEVFSFPLNDTKCHFLAITRGSSQLIKVYLDANYMGGFYANPDPFTPSPFNYLVDPYNTLVLGKSAPTTPPNFFGSIGQVRLWSRELTQNDICRNNKWKTPFNSTGLFADWDMTDASGTVLTNRINPGPTTNGTLVNGTAWKTQFSVGDCTYATGYNSGFNNFRPANFRNTISPSIKESSCRISPNPNNGEFELTYNSSPDKGKQFLSIYSVAGKLIYAKLLTGNSPDSISLPLLSSGVYILRIINEKKEVVIKKMVVENR